MATRELSEMLLWNCGQTLQRYQSVHGGCEKTFHFRMSPIAFHHLWVDALNGGGQRRLLLVLHCPLVPVKMAPALLFLSDSRLSLMKDRKGALKWIGSVYVKTTVVNILITGRRKENYIKTDLFYKSYCLFSLLIQHHWLNPHSVWARWCDPACSRFMIAPIFLLNPLSFGFCHTWPPDRLQGDELLNLRAADHCVFLKSCGFKSMLKSHK